MRARAPRGAAVRPRALILSGSIGQGHATVAEVCSAALAETSLGERPGGITTADCIELLGPLSSRVADRLYRATISWPALYDGFHFAHLRAEGKMAAGGDAKATARVLRGLERRLCCDDLLLSLAVFATGAPVAAALASRRAGARSVVFCTDATAHSKWADESIDLYVVTSELAAVSLRRYLPRAEVALVPPPVRAPFYAAPPQAEARSFYEIPQDESCVLLVGGGWGLGPLGEAAAALAGAGHYVLAVAGANRRLEAELSALAGRDHRVRSLGFCRDMPATMAAADVVVSGAGQTCSEVHAVGRRLVVLDVVPGHGRENLLHEVITRRAVAASPSARSVVAAVETVLKCDEEAPAWPVGSAEEWSERFRAALAPLGVF